MPFLRKLFQRFPRISIAVCIKDFLVGGRLGRNLHVHSPHTGCSHSQIGDQYAALGQPHTLLPREERTHTIVTACPSPRRFMRSTLSGASIKTNHTARRIASLGFTRHCPIPSASGPMRSGGKVRSTAQSTPHGNVREDASSPGERVSVAV